MDHDGSQAPTVLPSYESGKRNPVVSPNSHGPSAPLTRIIVAAVRSSTDRKPRPVGDYRSVLPGLIRLAVTRLRMHAVTTALRG
jgi:hypothetical protein